MNVLLDLLFGKSSENYNQLYNEGLIDETFSYDYTQEQGFGFAMVGGDTRNLMNLLNNLKKCYLMQKREAYFTEEQLERAKKKENWCIFTGS